MNTNGILWRGKPSNKIVLEWLFGKRRHKYRKSSRLSFIFFFLMVFLFFKPITQKIYPFYSSNFILLIILLIILLLFVSRVIYLLLLVKTYEYTITNKGIHLKGGIFMKEESFIPSYKITNTVLRRSIIERILNIGSIEFQTAGTGGLAVPEVIFQGLINYNTALKETYKLLEKRKKQ